MIFPLRTITLPLLLLACSVSGQLPSRDTFDPEDPNIQKHCRLATNAIPNHTTVSNCQFIDNTNFYYTTFPDTLLFYQMDFHKDVSFFNSSFGHKAMFSSVNFHGELTLAVSECLGNFIFSRDSLLASGDFDDFLFYEGAEFEKCFFKGPATFDQTIFYKDVSFKSSSFLARITFDSTVFLGNFDLRYVRIYGDRINLTTAKTDTVKGLPKHKIGIMLSGADIPKIKIDYYHFYLLFDSSSTYEDSCNVYQSLLNNFKTDGFTESYELLDKEYRTCQYRHKKQWFRLWVDKNWWDFGYAKHYVFYWIFRFMVIFTFLNVFFYPFLNKEVYTINNIKTKFPWWNIRQLPSRCYYALVYTAVLFFSLSVKLENLKYKIWYGVLYVFLIYALGIVCLAYTANFILQK